MKRSQEPPSNNGSGPDGAVTRSHLVPLPAIMDIYYFYSTLGPWFTERAAALRRRLLQPVSKMAS